MKEKNQILMQYLREQIALEEQLCSVIQDQIAKINEISFRDAKEVLEAASQLLELQFMPLNDALDTYEEGDLPPSEMNGKLHSLPQNTSPQHMQVSRILQEDYAALNHVTISNTLLHTLALAVGDTEVAKLSLHHLENLVPLVKRIEELVPHITTRELSKQYPSANPKAAEIALGNTKRVWKKAS